MPAGDALIIMPLSTPGWDNILERGRAHEEENDHDAAVVCVAVVREEESPSRCAATALVIAFSRRARNMLSATSRE